MVSPETGNLEMSTSDNYFSVYIRRIKEKSLGSPHKTNKDTDWTKTENSSFNKHY